MLKLTFILFAWTFFHPVHVSLTSIDYDEESSAFNLFMKVYSDDLQDDCRLLTGNPALQLYDGEHMPDRDVIQAYIDSRIIMEADSVRLKGEVGNIEADSEEVRINVSYSYSGGAKSFRIGSTVMTTLFADQANLLIFRIGNREEAFKFTPEMTEVIIKR